MKRSALCLLSGVVALLIVGCEGGEPEVKLAPTSSGLGPAKPAPKGAETFAVESAGSKVDFMMEAPVEVIRGKVHDATKGEIAVDLMDVTKSTGKLVVDISGIELFQKKRKDDKSDFGAEEKVPKQNEHARQWLEIGPDAPPDKKELYERIEFTPKKIDGCSATDVTKMTGAERKITCTVTGDFLLHGRTTEKTTKVEITFKYDGDKPSGLALKTSEPFAVGLAEHDVHPREAFGKLAQNTLEILSPKVAKDAQVSFEVTAKATGGSTAPASASATP